MQLFRRKAKHGKPKNDFTSKHGVFGWFTAATTDGLGSAAHLMSMNFCFKPDTLNLGWISCDSVVGFVGFDCSLGILNGTLSARALVVACGAGINGGGDVICFLEESRLLKSVNRRSSGEEFNTTLDSAAWLIGLYQLFVLRGSGDGLLLVVFFSVNIQKE